METYRSAEFKAGQITIDDEFQKLIPAMSDEERKQLEENIVAQGGARDPITLWLRDDFDFVLLDGHNRYEICTRVGLPFTAVAMDFGTRDEAADWIDRNQLGRRNLSKQDYKLLLGRRYNRAKKTPDQAGAMKGKALDKMSTASSLAAEHGVDEKTVRRAGKFQAAAAKLGIEKDIAAGKVKATEAAVVKAGTALPKQPTQEQIEAAQKRIAQPKVSTPKRAVKARSSNAAIANKITIGLIKLRNQVESLSKTGSKYRARVVTELQTMIAHLTRVDCTSKARP